MFRHFQIAKSLAYANDEASATTPKLKGGTKTTRCALIGIGYQGTNPHYALQNTIDKLLVSGRNFVQGDPFLAGLLSPMVDLIEDKSGGTQQANLPAQTLGTALTNSTGATADTTLQKTVVAEGVHTWGGGAAATDSIEVAGILGTDSVLVTLNAPGAGGATALLTAEHDTGNGQIDLTLDGNGEDAVTTLSYTVLRSFAENDENTADLAAQIEIHRAQLAIVRDGMASLAAACNQRGAGHGVNPFFPGTAFELDDGTRCGGIPVHGGEDVKITLTDLTGGSAQIDSVVFYFVEFDCDDADVGELARARWQRFDCGEGVTHFVGDVHSYAAAFTQNLTVIPEPQHGRHLRRLEVLGAIDDNAGIVREADFQALNVQIGTDNLVPPQNDTLPARRLIGHGGLHLRGVNRVDLAENGESTIYVAAPAPTTGTNYLRLCHVFEGRRAGPQRELSSRAIN